MSGTFSRIGAALDRPSANMTWLQLGGAVVFVIVVLIAWRMVVRAIMQEI